MLKTAHSLDLLRVQGLLRRALHPDAELLAMGQYIPHHQGGMAPR